MKVAIVGSKSLNLKTFAPFLPNNTTEIITGDSPCGIDVCIPKYAKENNIKCTVIERDPTLFEDAALAIRNAKIIEKADIIIAFWDGKSPTTHNFIQVCRSEGKKVTVKKFDFYNK